MSRMTTDNPQGNYSNALNLFYVKGDETWVRGGGPAPDFPDVSLYDYMRAIIRQHKVNIYRGVTNEELDELVPQMLLDGIETKEGLAATIYTAGWAFATLRWKLKNYEDAGLPAMRPEEAETIDRAIIEYGEIAQIDMAIEEMSELIKALCKRKRVANSGPEARAAEGAIIEELADVYIMLVQLVRIFQPCREHFDENLEATVRAKMERLKGRLDRKGGKTAT